jgi:hypothetical protein
MAVVAIHKWVDGLITGLGAGCQAEQVAQDEPPVGVDRVPRHFAAHKGYGPIGSGSPTSTVDNGLAMLQVPLAGDAHPWGSPQASNGDGSKGEAVAKAKAGMLRMGSTRVDSTAVSNWRDEFTASTSKAKEIAAQIADIQKAKAKLDPQVEHYLKVAERPGITLSDKAKCTSKVKQLKKEQASQSRSALPCREGDGGMRLMLEALSCDMLSC